MSFKYFKFSSPSCCLNLGGEALSSAKYCSSKPSVCLRKVPGLLFSFVCWLVQLDFSVELCPSHFMCCLGKGRPQCWNVNSRTCSRAEGSEHEGMRQNTPKTRLTATEDIRGTCCDSQDFRRKEISYHMVITQFHKTWISSTVNTADSQILGGGGPSGGTTIVHLLSRLYSHNGFLK